MLVVDASVVAPALADDGTAGQVARDRLRGEDLIAPHLVDLEVASVLRRQLRTGALELHRAEAALTHLASLPIRRASSTSLMRRIWALRDNLTVYDASYVALAEALGATLLTSDRGLAAAPGPTCRFEVLHT